MLVSPRWGRRRRYDDAVDREGLLSKAITGAGFRIDSAQWGATTRFGGGDLPAERGADGYVRCAGVDLDVFYREGWYGGTTPDPAEFLFYKTNRGVGAAALAARTASSATKRGRAPPRVLLASHNWDLDGAPTFLRPSGNPLGPGLSRRPRREAAKRSFSEKRGGALGNILARRGAALDLTVAQVPPARRRGLEGGRL